MKKKRARKNWRLGLTEKQLRFVWNYEQIQTWNSAHKNGILMRVYHERGQKRERNKNSSSQVTILPGLYTYAWRSLCFKRFLARKKSLRVYGQKVYLPEKYLSNESHVYKSRKKEKVEIVPTLPCICRKITWEDKNKREKNTCSTIIYSWIKAKNFTVFLKSKDGKKRLFHRLQGATSSGLWTKKFNSSRCIECKRLISKYQTSAC